MKNTTFILTALCLIVIIAAVTNPSPETHKEMVRSELMNHIQEKMSKEEGPENFGQAFGNFIANALIDKVVETAVTSEDYVLFSLTKTSWQGEEKNIGFGAFGNVWLSAKVKDALDKQGSKSTSVIQ